MQYSNKDYELLGRQVAAGRYISRSTCALALVLALLAGLSLGRYVFPDTAAAPLPGASEQKRPLNRDSDLIAAADHKRQLMQAIAQHEEGLRRDPHNAETWEHLGNLYFDVDEPEQSVAAYNRALELNPGNSNVLVDCGVMYRQMKQYDKALEYFQKAIGIDPKHENALFNSGVVLYHDLNRKEDGLNAWRALVTVNPDARTPSGHPVSTLIEEHQ